MRRVVPGIALLIVLSGCSLQRLAVNKLGDALANGGTTFSSDDDPELVGDALPFSLKLMESLLAESPRHRPLLVATSRGFTQYTYGWISQSADELESTDIAAATAKRQRARSLYLRARDYGMRALAERDPRIADSIGDDPRAAASLARREDVPALYWTAAAWGLAISLSKDDPDIVADVPVVEALIVRAYDLDPSFDSGALETFLITYEMARPTAGPDAVKRARDHFARAVELSSGRLASPYVAYAEAVCVQQQDRAEFEKTLERALQIDVNAAPEWRLQNVIARRRAAWLLTRASDLFVDDRTEGAQP